MKKRQTNQIRNLFLPLALSAISTSASAQFQLQPVASLDIGGGSLVSLSTLGFSLEVGGQSPLAINPPVTLGLPDRLPGLGNMPSADPLPGLGDLPGLDSLPMGGVSSSSASIPLVGNIPILGGFLENPAKIPVAGSIPNQITYFATNPDELPANVVVSVSNLVGGIPVLGGGVNTVLSPVEDALP